MKRQVSGQQWIWRIGTALLGVLVLVWAARVSAQAPVAVEVARTDGDLLKSGGCTLGGTVLDPSGAVIPTARVVLVREAPATTTEALSGDDGSFRFDHLAPGPYRVTVEREGFH